MKRISKKIAKRITIGLDCASHDAVEALSWAENSSKSLVVSDIISQFLAKKGITHGKEARRRSKVR